jgi:LysR family hydrogen peroxide-inducible transcriptional activator
MEIHQLRYFVAVIETGGFTAAARRCFVSQPALSQQIKKLEDELGQRLINRLGRHAETTPAGAAFYDRARQILIEIEEAARAVHDEGEGGRLRLGVLPSLAPYILAGLLRRLRNRAPGITVEVDEDFRSGLVDRLVSGALDLVIATLPPDHPNLEVEVLFREPLLVALPEGHPLLKTAELRPADLAGQKLVMLGEASSLGLQIRRFFGDRSIPLQVACRCSQVKTVKTLVAAGLGVAIVPKMSVGMEHPGIRYRAMTEAEPEREIVLVRHRLRFRSRVEQVFTEVLRQFCAERAAELAAQGGS